MVQSPSWAADWLAASQEIRRISRNPKVHYRTHKRMYNLDNVILKHNHNQFSYKITRNVVVVHFHNYFWPSKETVRFPEAKNPSLN
jgi:hypothetical protein